MSFFAADVELSTKLQEEIQYEKEASEQAGAEPDFVKEFKADGVWKVWKIRCSEHKKVHHSRLSVQIEQQEGHDEVALVRQFGNETCVSTFFDSIKHIAN